MTAFTVPASPLSPKWPPVSATCALSHPMSSNPPWATPSPLHVRCVIGARHCRAGSRLIGLMAGRPIGSPSADIYGSGLILFFRGLTLDQILAVLAGTRGHSLPQNKLLC